MSKAESIYEPSMGCLKVKPTRFKPRPVINDDIQIPSDIYKKSSNISLGSDVIYINDIVFMVSIDRQSRYRLIINIKSQNEK